jgi:hypothetical protein
LSVWCFDEAGPYATLPYSGASWTRAGQPARYPHEYFPNGTAKILTLFHPHSGQVRLKGVTHCPNSVLHGWLKMTLSEILSTLPHSESPYSLLANYCHWQSWRDGLDYLTLPAHLPPLRMLLVMDNLAGHKTHDFVVWLRWQGILPLYTPLGGSWLNMSESIQRLLKRRALSGQTPTHPEQIMTWFEETAQAWNRDPTPFEWYGRRYQRRQRQRDARYLLGGSGACTHRPLHRLSPGYGYPHVE